MVQVTNKLSLRGTTILTPCGKITDDLELFKRVAELEAKMLTKASTAFVYSKKETYNKTEIDAKVAAVFRYKGRKASLAELYAITDAVVGDVWSVLTEEYVYTSEFRWELLGSMVDWSAYVLNKDYDADKLLLNIYLKQLDASKFTAISDDKAIPAPSVETEGGVFIYVGTTTDYFIKGSRYVCKYDLINQVYIWQNIESSGGGGSGPPGPPGKDGRSAYQIALSQGFVGTEQEWLASLVGKEGPTGKTGKDGSSVNIIGTLEYVDDLPEVGNRGDGYLIDGDLWVWAAPIWVNQGRIQGPPGKDGSTYNAGVGIKISGDVLSTDPLIVATHNSVDTKIATAASPEGIIGKEIDKKANTKDLSTVAISGKYADLKEIPKDIGLVTINNYTK